MQKLFDGSARKEILTFESSKLLKEAEYDKLTGLLKVTFNTALENSYEYYGVPEQVILDWKEAKSKGRYFSDNIKNKFTTKKSTFVFVADSKAKKETK